VQRAGLLRGAGGRGQGAGLGFTSTGGKSQKRLWSCLQLTLSGSDGVKVSVKVLAGNPPTLQDQGPLSSADRA
jgi:hypothetical protein